MRIHRSKTARRAIATMAMTSSGDRRKLCPRNRRFRARTAVAQAAVEGRNCNGFCARAERSRELRAEESSATRRRRAVNVTQVIRSLRFLPVASPYRLAALIRGPAGEPRLSAPSSSRGSLVRQAGRHLADAFVFVLSSRVYQPLSSYPLKSG